MQEGRASLRKGSQIRGAQEGTKWSGGARLVTRRDTPQAEECWPASQEVPQEVLGERASHHQWECQQQDWEWPLCFTPSCGENLAGQPSQGPGDRALAPAAQAHTAGRQSEAPILSPPKKRAAGLPCQERGRMWAGVLDKASHRGPGQTISFQLPKSLSGLAQGRAAGCPCGRALAWHSYHVNLVCQVVLGPQPSHSYAPGPRSWQQKPRS